MGTETLEGMFLALEGPRRGDAELRARLLAELRAQDAEDGGALVRRVAVGGGYYGALEVPSLSPDPLEVIILHDRDQQAHISAGGFRYYGYPCRTVPEAVVDLIKRLEELGHRARFLPPVPRPLLGDPSRMTPAALSAHLDRLVHGSVAARGAADGVVWEVRPRPGAAGYRITVALPWSECPPGIAEAYDADSSTATHAILGKFCEDPDPTAVLRGVADWRIRPAKAEGSP